MRRMPNCAAVMTALSAAVCLAGCSILPEPRQGRIEYFDLKPPAQLKSPPVEVEQFVTFSGERSRMVRRKRDIFVESSDFYKWAQSPGALLTRYLRLAFRTSLQSPASVREKCVIVRGEVLTFEMNGENAVLGVRYQLKYGSQAYCKTVLLTEKMKGSSPSAFAEAMSRAADRFVRSVAAEIGKLTEKRK